jgi:hypothetical protein
MIPQRDAAREDGRAAGVDERQFAVAGALPANAVELSSRPPDDTLPSALAAAGAPHLPVSEGGVAIAAIFFDLYETPITEFKPGRRPRPSVAQRLGIAREAFDSEWRARRERRMCGMLPDYPATLREIRQAVGRQPNEEMIRQLHAGRAR